MCGILCCVSYDKNEISCPLCDLKLGKLVELDEILKRRGPTISNRYCSNLASQNYKNVKLHFTAHVLWSRGEQPEAQPITDQDNNCQLVYNGDIYSFDAFDETDELCRESETQNDAVQLFAKLKDCSSGITGIPQVIQSLRGPFAFIYHENGRIWFGRDFFGRESLILSFYDQSMYISSVSNFENVFEIPAIGLFCLEIETKRITIYPWDCHQREDMDILGNNFRKFVEDTGFRISDGSPLKFISTTLTASLNNDCSNEIFRRLEASHGNIEIATEILHKKVDQFLVHLRSSVRRRVTLKPPACKNCISPCSHTKICVLFSGGLDSTVLAYLVAECLEPGETLDLINVAFSKTEDFSSVPDRVTGLEASKILKNIFEPRGISILFRTVDVHHSTLVEMRDARIKTLISPLKSVLDDSLGCCLWFAAGCESSCARIMIVGSGADELLGGYSRHRVAFKNGGWERLKTEMQLEIDRISVRNMGRDNRVLSDHGVVPRIPFLDEKLVEFLVQDCELWEKCFVLFERGIGEKILLRAAAFELMGVKELAILPKRAMQFGSRIAKLENSKEKGKDVCRRLGFVEEELG